MSRGLLERRRGALPPILTALITIAALVSAALVGWFIFTTTSSAVRQPVLDIVDAYYLPGANPLFYMTVRNLGTSDVTLQLGQITCSGTSSSTIYNGTYSSIRVVRGSTVVVRYTSVSGTPRDGDLCIVQVSITAPVTATIIEQFRIVTP
jgi:hypothetical protein